MTDIILRVWSTIISCVEIGLLVYFFNKLEKKDNTRIKLWQAYLGLFLVETGLNVYNINDFVKLIVLIICVLLICKYLYYVTYKKAILNTFIYFAVLICSEVVSVALINLSNPNFDVYEIQNNFLLNMQGTIIARTLNFIFLVIVNKFFNLSRNNYQISEFAVVFIPGIVNITILIYILNFLYENSFKKNEPRIEFIVISIIISFSVIAIILFFEKFMKNKEYNQRMELLKQEIISQNQLQKNFWESSKTNIAQLDKSMYFLNQEAKGKLENNNIVYDLKINKKHLVPLKSDDLNNIINNVASIAIEDCKQIENVKRAINAKTYEKEHINILEFTSTINDKKNIVYSNNKRKLYLANIETIIRKYNGKMNIDVYQSMFILTIIFPKI